MTWKTSVAMVLGCVALAGCGSGNAADGEQAEPSGVLPTSSTSTPPAPVKSSTAAAVTTPATTSPAAVVVRRDDRAVGAAWVSPSGNLSCWINAPTESTSGDAGCWAQEHTWVAPTPKETCYASYGSMVAVTAGSVDYVCRGDIPSCLTPSVDQHDACGAGAQGSTTDKPGLWWHRSSDGLAPPVEYLGRQAALPYGAAVRVGDFECTSRESGMACSHLPTGRAFTMSRAVVVIR